VTDDRQELTRAKPRLLDLFCCAGGAAKGYQEAGFHVTGVDIKPQPNYVGDRFFQMDALKALDFNGHVHPSLGRFDVIHASPPCQGYSDLRHRTGREYPMLVEIMRSRLRLSGLPYVLENVEGAPLIAPIVLCGTMFPELRVIRHRLFESNHPLMAPQHGKHPLVFTHDKRKAHYGKLDQDTSFVQVTGGGNCSIKNAREAMGIDWMTKAELNEAIPPAYTRHIGEQIARHLMWLKERAAS
jgi:DNA (cytosine-5)-methyltransferase 1